VRLLTKHLAEDEFLEQWFLVALPDDEQAKVAVARTTKIEEAVIEVVGHIPAAMLAGWGLTEGDVRLVLPGEARLTPASMLMTVGPGRTG
jgi:hypothetical protein